MHLLGLTLLVVNSWLMTVWVDLRDFLEIRLACATCVTVYIVTLTTAF